ncbi:hypothetical protein GCM10011490_07240 [Pseudoclavibacter endophyticus]|uniref:Uncharacterized protein n=1 Tax=Pseudoclavibacter endophyticus TaxID=1778590 RepID=A0A6H9WKW4_9MICO|nr:hypothetical protein [Pseudoclavibacter endophyticus]KAB1649793.1 hypothetical protein F8O04_06065 [Pseudoclavibacter endophyticus]GGA59704.1 hypothetical protein GCM10011490_07240 [Pseudoclavibacter endophyticus]
MRERAFRVYAVAMVCAVAVVPLARAVWLSLAGAGGLHLAAAATPATVVIAIACLWSGALIAGGMRGPALLRPFPTWVRASSDRSRVRDFGPATLRGGAVVTAATTVTAAAIATAFISNGLAAPLAAVPIAGAGALIGVLASVAWLAGQSLGASSRAAGTGAMIAAAGVVAALASGSIPQSAAPAATVAAWAALPLPTLLAGLAVLAVALTGCVPWLLNRLEPALLVRQAVRADAASGYAEVFELGGALSLYRAVPSAGRRVRAVGRHRMLAVAFARRDAVGTLRSPWRLAAGVAGLAAAGVSVLAAAGFAVAAADAAGGVAAGVGGGAAWPLGALAGVLAYAAFGSFTDGVRHAADAAETTALYGVGDGTLMMLHAIFPLVAGVGILVLVAIVAALVLSGAVPGAGIAGMIGHGVAVAAGSAAAYAAPAALGVLTLAVRVADARKGPMPVAMLTPIPTEAGDLGALRRVVWAVDALLLAILAGVGAAVLPVAPAISVVAVIAIVAVAARRGPRVARE